jgi:hypothetical protein
MTEDKELDLEVVVTFEQEKQFRENMAETLESIGAQMKVFSDIVLENLRPQLQEMSGILVERWQREFAPLFRSLAEVMQQWLEAVEKESKLVEPLLRRAKLWYTPSMPRKLLINLKELSEQNSNLTKEQIEQVFVDYYAENDGENLRTMVSSWSDSPIYKRRMPIILDALDAHIAGKYTLSIPALLPQVEGILSSITGETAGRPGKILKRAIEHDYPDVKVFNAISKDILITLATDPFLYKGNIGEFFTPEKFNGWITTQGLNGQPLNRHAILHGVQIDYPSKTNSLRVFFLLDSIHWIASGKMKIKTNKS